ncbi:MAG: PKD domain-containing protein [Crocinitomicaceae bacterium]|nr:PKD domain-containing protein [Crocinitomicaceae bacterium]
MRKLILSKLSALLILMFSFGAAAQMQIPFAPASNLQTFSTCNGFIIDSGGQGGPGYSNNESTIITICPDTPGEIISVVFNLFSLDLTNTGTAQNPNVDIMNVYDGTSTAANSLGSYSGTQLQGVVIEATALNPTGCLTLEFISNSTGTGMFTASVACETPCNDPQAGGFIVNGIAPDSIRVCPGEIVNFQEQGSFAQPGFNLVSYDWDFMDGTTATGQSVSHSYSIPGQYRVQLFVTDDNGCSNPNLIDLEVLVGTYPDFTGFPGDTTICLGESMDFSASPNTYEVQWNGFSGTQTISDGCLPDTLLGVSQDIQLVQTGFAAGTTITAPNDIQSICLDLEHSFMGDLVIIIECPNGQNAILHQQGGGGTQLGVPVQADNVDCSDPTTIGVPFTYCFEESAPLTWVDWVNANPGVNTLPAGSYASIDPLSNLIGCPTNGVWTLTVIDNWAADDGTVFSFGLNLDPSFYPPITTFQPDIGTNSDSSYWVTPAPYLTSISPDGNDISVMPTVDGTYNYQYVVVDNFGCTNDTSVNLTVNPNPIVNAGNDTTVCVGNLLQLMGDLSGPGSSSLCNYSLILDDTFGDGWNGNTVTVTVNGVSTDYTLAAGNAQTFVIPVPSGTTVTVTFNANGAFVNECQYSVEDESGNVVFAQGPNLAGVTTNTFVPNCTPAFVFDWTPPGSLNDPAIIDPLMTVTTQETLTLSVYPIGHPLCAVTDDITISVAANPDPGVDAAVSFCASANPIDLLPLLGPTADPNGMWQDPNGNPVVMPYDPATMPVGDYKYVVGISGCNDSSIVSVSQIITEITSITPTNISCNGLTDGMIDFSGNNFTEYTVNGGAAIVSGSPVNISGLSAGAYTIEVTSPDGCTDTETVNITEPAVLTVAVNTVDATCFGLCDGQAEVVPAGGTAPYAYVWNQGVAGDQTGNATTICAGNYDVDVVDSRGCTANATYTINEPANVIPGLIPDTTSGCFPHQVDFVNTSASPDIVTTEVDFGDGSTQSFVGLASFEHTYADPGIYTVTMTVSTTNGCQYTETYVDLIQAHNAPNANFFVSPDYVSMLEPTVNLYSESSGDVVSWNWTINNAENIQSANTEDVLDVTFPPDAPGQYEVTLITENAFGCIDSITRFVTIVNDVILYAPNTFTPDDDEFNQAWEFHISGIDIYDFNLRIFNRWGEVIWESNDPSVSWDGTYNGKLVQDGTYTWFMDCGDLQNDKRYTFTGHINVIR